MISTGNFYFYSFLIFNIESRYFPMYSFRNDYSEGAHPVVLQALTDTNLVQTSGYGTDEYCAEAAQLIRDL